MEKEYTDIIRLFETERYVEANRYLDSGWVLIRTYTTCYDTNPTMCNNQSMHYVLGWTLSNGIDIKYPEDQCENQHKYGIYL